MRRIFDAALTWRRAALAVALLLVAGCDGDSGTGPPSPPGPPGNTRVLPDTIHVGALLESVKDDIPGRDSNGFYPPTADDRIAMVGIFEEARSGNVARADSLANVYRYDVEATVDEVHGDTLVVMIERAPIQRGWGTYMVRRGGYAMDVHVNHPMFDVNTPAVAAVLYNTCRCRALLMAGTHRYANPNDESDMARATQSVFQGIHEALADDAVMVVSVHGFARGNYGEPIASSDAVVSLGANGSGTLAANDDARALRDSLDAAGFVVGLIADDEDYTELTASPNPQGRYSNTEFGHGRWIHIELAREVRDVVGVYTAFMEVVARWGEGLEEGVGGRDGTRFPNPLLLPP